MSHPVSFTSARDPLPDHEQKQAALGYLNEAWAEARLYTDFLGARDWLGGTESVTGSVTGNNA